MKLDDYLAREGLSQAQFADSLMPTVSPGLVSQWVNGTTRITLARGLEIQRITKGAVTVEDCAALFNKEAA